MPIGDIEKLKQATALLSKIFDEMVTAEELIADAYSGVEATSSYWLGWQASDLDRATKLVVTVMHDFNDEIDMHCRERDGR